MIKTPRQELLNSVDQIISGEQLDCSKQNTVWSFTEKTARAIVKMAFEGHLRKSLQPTLTHIFTVAGMDDTGKPIRDISMEDRIIRLFHDLFEDTELEISDGELWGVKTNTLDKISLLSREDDIPYLDYIVKLSYDPQCVDIKLDDIKDNLDLSENINLIAPEYLEKINRKIIANNYLKAVNSEIIPAGYNILSFMKEHCTGNNIDTAIQIIEDHSTAILRTPNQSSGPIPNN